METESQKLRLSKAMGIFPFSDPSAALIIQDLIRIYDLININNINEYFHLSPAIHPSSLLLSILAMHLKKSWLLFQHIVVGDYVFIGVTKIHYTPTITGGCLNSGQNKSFAFFSLFTAYPFWKIPLFHIFQIKRG